ncbi:hypothetical protein [Gloeocapsopsis dulcis]|nr:hypothetical protein [Gloeocapsopsis dulcis]WNN88385.1 hypothetical protein P0S91_19140 [Gloeocapsopsis dulcis]
MELLLDETTNKLLWAIVIATSQKPAWLHSIVAEFVVLFFEILS